MLTKNLTRAAKSFVLIVSELIAFLSRPKLGGVAELSSGEKTRTGIGLFILSIMTTILFGVLAMPVILATDLTAGDKIDEALSGSAWAVLLSVVILGPLVEEIIFRGWLSGTWCSVLATAFGLTAIYGGSALLDSYLGEGSAIKPLILAAGAIAIFSVFSLLDSANRIFGFDRIFPFVFYAQAVAFGALHFQNYAASSLAIALFATLPLIACGLIWGYARVRLGLASAVILHAAYNVPAAIGTIVMVNFAG